MNRRTSVIRRVDKVLGAIQWASMLTACVALVVLIATFGWLVFGRKVLNETPTWVEQLSLVLICYIVFLGAAAGVRTNSHLGVTVFRDMLPIAFQKVVIVIIDIIIAAFGLVTVVSSYGWVAFGWDSFIPMLNIPESFRSAAILVFGGIVFLFAGARAISRILTFSEWVPEDPLLDDAIKPEGL